MTDNNDDNNTYHSILNDEIETENVPINNNTCFKREDYLWGILITTTIIIITSIIILLYFI
jgi:hypothetical protein